MVRPRAFWQLPPRVRVLRDALRDGLRPLRIDLRVLRALPPTDDTPPFHNCFFSFTNLSACRFAAFGAWPCLILLLRVACVTSPMLA